VKFRNVTKEEFDAWLAAYPRPLVRDVYAAGEPPLVTFNDFAVAPAWPQSAVASYFLGEDAARWKVADPIPDPS
jgi:hypothetical protein